MGFSVLPPEINSGRMYAGQGSGPVLNAASAGNGVPPADETSAPVATLFGSHGTEYQATSSEPRLAAARPRLTRTWG